MDEKFTVWFTRAIASFFGKQGILFAINLTWVFLSWSFFIMIFFALDRMPQILGLETVYQNKSLFMYGSLILFIITSLVTSWTYWDAYVRLARPDRRVDRKIPVKSEKRSKFKSFAQPGQVDSTLEQLHAINTSTGKSPQEKPPQKKRGPKPGSHRTKKPDTLSGAKSSQSQDT